MSFSKNLSTKDINYLIKHKNIEFYKIKTLKEKLQKEYNNLEQNNIRDLTVDEYHLLTKKVVKIIIYYNDLCSIEDKSGLDGIENKKKNWFYLSHFELLYVLRRQVEQFEKIYNEKKYIL